MLCFKFNFSYACLDLSFNVECKGLLGMRVTLVTSLAFNRCKPAVFSAFLCAVDGFISDFYSF